MNLHRSFVALFLGSLVLWSCGGGGGGGGGSLGSGRSQVAVTFGDAPSDDLMSLQFTVAAAFLVREDGSESENLLETARLVNLLDLSAKSALLQMTSVEPGRYAGARLVLDTTSVVGRDLTGAEVPVRTVGQSFESSFAAPIPLQKGALHKVHFEIEAETSIDDDPQMPGGYVFRPVLRIERRDGSEDLLDEIHGFVVSTEPARRRLVVNLIDRDTGSSFGSITVQIDNATHLLDDDGAPFASEAAFFAAAPQSRLEADGALRDDGVFLASFLKIEQDDDDVARIRGSITSIDTGLQVLTLRIQDVREGWFLVDSVLESLGRPAEIEIDYRNSLIVVEGDNPRTGSPADLVLGQTVDAKFSVFALPQPFAARKIEIEDERPEFEGTIVDNLGLPGQFIVHLEPHDPAVLSGRVASSTTDVLVLLDGSERLFLKVDHEPSLAAASLFTNLRVRVRGEISGPPTAPILDAFDVRVRPGRLDADVLSADPVAGTFVLDIEDLDDPFGGPGLTNPVTASFAPSARVRKDADSVEEFFDLVTRGPVEVRAFGLADGSGGIVVHVLEADEK